MFWQSIMNSTNPADFEAYLAQFPGGVLRTLAENRLAGRRPRDHLNRAGRDPTPTKQRLFGAASVGPRTVFLGHGSPIQNGGDSEGNEYPVTVQTTYFQ